MKDTVGYTGQNIMEKRWTKAWFIICVLYDRVQLCTSKVYPTRKNETCAWLIDLKHTVNAMEYAERYFRALIKMYFDGTFNSYVFQGINGYFFTFKVKS